MELSIDGHNLQHDTWYPRQNLNNLSVLWNGKSNEYYTLLFHDLDMGYSHLLITNIPGSDISRGNHLISYMIPNPPHDATHEYLIGLYRQQQYILSFPSYNRYHFDLNNFLSQYNLQPIAQALIITDQSKDSFYLVEN